MDQYAYPKAATASATAYSLLSATNRITRYVSDSTDKDPLGGSTDKDAQAGSTVLVTYLRGAISKP